MSQYRSSQLYIRHETRRLLRIVAKARGLDETVDQVGDELLEKAILEKCPELVPLLAEMEALEERMSQAVIKR